MKLFKRIKIMWRKRKLEKLGFDFSNIDMKQIYNPCLSDYELKKMESDDIPTDDEIGLYYLMYLKKFELDRVDDWSVEEPISLEKFEKMSKTPTETIHEEGETITIQILGGYRWMITKTVDAIIGFPPDGGIYHRYVDYEKLVKENA